MKTSKNIVRQIIPEFGFNLLIGLTTLLLAISLIEPTKLLLQFQMDWNYDKMYISLMLPACLLAILLSILIFVKDLNLSVEINRPALSLLVINAYSFYLIMHYFPLFYIESVFGSFAYQMSLSLGNYITLIYSLTYIKRLFNKR